MNPALAQVGGPPLLSGGALLAVGGLALIALLAVGARWMSKRRGSPPGGSRREKAPEGAEMLEHWFTLVPQQGFSALEFYEGVERAIKAQKVPSLESRRVDLAEGGALSDAREYLRMSRERLTFDVCAAPVGTSFFFSYRFYLLPAKVGPLQIAALLVAAYLLVYLSARAIGPVLGPALVAALCAYGLWLARNAIGLGMRDLDSWLLNSPLVGALYERYLRRDTFYRQDLRMAYCQIVSSIVKGAAEEAMGSAGAELRRTVEYAPYLERYRSVPVTPPLGGA